MIYSDREAPLQIKSKGITILRHEVSNRSCDNQLNIYKSDNCDSSPDSATTDSESEVESDYYSDTAICWTDAEPSFKLITNPKNPEGKKIVAGFTKEWACIVGYSVDVNGRRVEMVASYTIAEWANLNT